MKNIILILSIFLTIANCSLQKPIKHHGVHKLEWKQKKLIINETNKNDIIKILGPPSVESKFDKVTLSILIKVVTCQTVSIFGFLLARIENKRVCCLNVVIDDITWKNTSLSLWKIEAW